MSQPSLTKLISHLEAPKVSSCGLQDAILRSLSPLCFPRLLSFTSNHSSGFTVYNITFHLDGVHQFSLRDLERLKQKTAWLSDSHVDFALRCVLFFSIYSSSISIKQGFFRKMSDSKSSLRPEYAAFALLFLDAAFSGPSQVYSQISNKDKAIGI